MAYQDFRTFLALLAREGQLRAMDGPVALGPSVASLATPSGAGDGPAVLIQRVEGRHARLALGVHGSLQRIALALGVPPNSSVLGVLAAMAERLEESSIEPGFVAPSAAPCKQVVLRGAAIDLGRLPVPRWRRDVFPLLDKAVLIARDPSTGVQQVGVAPLRVTGARELRTEPAASQWLARLEAPTRSSAPLDVAVALGTEPTIPLAALTPLPATRDRYALASALRGAAVVLTEGEGSELEVPANAELVLEAWMDREDAAGGAHRRILHVHTLTHRREPILDALHDGWYGAEGVLLRGVPPAAAGCRRLLAAFPDLAAAGPANSAARPLRPDGSAAVVQALGALGSSDAAPPRLDAWREWLAAALRGTIGSPPAGP